MTTVPHLTLYFIAAEQESTDSFVRAMSVADAVRAWKDFHRGQYDPDLDLTVITVPVDIPGVGVIPWESIASEEIEL